eukprot:1900998-Rhodomonas_salina.2
MQMQATVRLRAAFNLSRHEHIANLSRAERVSIASLEVNSRSCCRLLPLALSSRPQAGRICANIEPRIVRHSSERVKNPAKFLALSKTFEQSSRRSTAFRGRTLRAVIHPHPQHVCKGWPGQRLTLYAKGRRPVRVERVRAARAGERVGSGVGLAVAEAEEGAEITGLGIMEAHFILQAADGDDETAVGSVVSARVVVGVLRTTHLDVSTDANGNTCTRPSTAQSCTNELSRPEARRRSSEGEKWSSPMGAGSKRRYTGREKEARRSQRQQRLSSPAVAASAGCPLLNLGQLTNPTCHCPLPTSRSTLPLPRSTKFSRSAPASISTSSLALLHTLFRYPIPANQPLPPPSSPVTFVPPSQRSTSTPPSPVCVSRIPASTICGNR